MRLTYRMHTKADEPELIQFWSEHSGWDTMTAETWAHLMLRPPIGQASIVLAIDAASGRIVGQIAFIPSLIAVDGRQVSALRPFAPILANGARSFTFPNPLKHPVVAMYWHAIKALRKRGDGLIYMVPDPRWVRFLKIFPSLLISSFPLWSLKLPLDAPLPLGEGFSARPLEVYDERVDRLWAKAARLHGCLVVRDTRSLPWKIGSGDYHVTAVERGGELAGLVASRQKGDRQWLVCDMLAADAGDSLRATLAAVVNLGHTQALAAPPDKPIHKVAVLTTAVIEPVVRDMGFFRDNYNFPMVVHILDTTIPKEELAPARWYVSAND